MTALLVVTLAATVISVLFLRQSVVARTVENHLALAQTRWIERAAIDWAKVILRADARSGVVDYIGEPWSMPVADTRLDETVTGGAKLDDDARNAMLAGQIFDAQAKLNLNALMSGNEVSPRHVVALRTVLAMLGLAEELADGVVLRVQQSVPRTINGVAVPATMPPLVRLTDLLLLPGFDAATVEALSPYLIVLPKASRVNINTAPAEVIGALVPSVGISGGQRIVARRERTYFRDLNEAAAAIGEQVALSSDLFSVGSSYFLVRGMVRYARVESLSETLLERSADRVEIIWQQRN